MGQTGRMSPDKGDMGVEQMRSELKAMQFRLETAEQSNQTLHLLLKPVDQMRNELTAERKKHDGDYYMIRNLEASQSRLNEEVTELEASRAEARAAANLWKTR